MAYERLKPTYLQIHTCISLFSNCQKFFKFTGPLLLLPPAARWHWFCKYYHTEDSWPCVRLVNTEPLPVVQRAFSKGFYIYPKQPSFHLHNRTSTINTHRYCSCSSPTFSTIHSLHTVRQSALRAQHLAMHIQSTIRVRDFRERSRNFSKLHVLRRGRAFIVSLLDCVNLNSTANWIYVPV